MLKRYTLPKMQELWMREETKFERWLDVELAVLKARVERSEIPQDACEKIKQHARIDVAEITRLELEFDHDMIAFVASVQNWLERNGVGEVKGEFHKKLTSYDVEDPAFILMLRKAADHIRAALLGLKGALLAQAKKHQWTFMIARTHGQFAEPDTFGHLLLVFASAAERSVKRLDFVLENDFAEGKISGAVGTYASMEPAIEENALRELGLKPACAETQILQRDRHAMVMAVLATAAGTIEQMSRTFWEMMRSDVHELEEPRKPKQRGSSAMPQKKNPILTERLMGLSRVVRGCLSAAVVHGCLSAAMENIATPECRDISQSSVEREIFPTATSLVHYMAVKATGLVENLVVFPKRMRQNLEVATLGVWASQRVRLALMEKGVPPDAAYEHVQELAFTAVRSGMPLRNLVSHASPPGRIGGGIFTDAELDRCFDIRSYLEPGITYIFRNVE